MSWVSENKFVTGFGAAMLVGVGTFGYLIYAGMDKYDTAVGEFDAASSNLKKLQETKPSLTDAHLKELLAQKKEMTEKIGAFQKELKSRVLPIVSSILRQHPGAHFEWLGVPGPGLGRRQLRASPAQTAPLTPAVSGDPADPALRGFFISHAER